MSVDHAPSGVDNAADLRSDARMETILRFGLVFPALLLIGAVVMVPVGLLTFLSFTDDTGAFSFENYIRLVDSPTYLRVFLTTFRVSLLTSVICLILGTPLAYFLSQLRPRIANILLLAVLLPLWTSVLVRTYAWLIILQRNGLVNQAGMELGILQEPLALSFNELGAVIGTMHIMLPYMVLPIYAAMRKIDMNLVQAAASMGARPLTAFWSVFLPLAAPGIAAGVLIVFVLCLGFYVVPEILGGGKVVMLAMQIASDVQLFYNWGAAGALGVVLMIATVFIMAIAKKLTP
ncbi:MAG: ABC transporter permease [Rhodospirillaceae bacterium]|jgi:putative spermidine/putrescine transport system permease protein/spermidine/putrescine transport system permease protein|uniref:ABC transporter permease n=1 Tax=Hwanghaeella sp. 1Z406 TaxID=3402811 RepID=UPI000C3E6B55|nr:ABC transporter permease [Rhodospirillales bacterium]MAX49070.1 ABC transporter permease [Rhodospirillaceae bacterium]|tara:strand:- start:403 stop:1275 length:873 start_codon:yes stop_codon:yes gene_type:complete